LTEKISQRASSSKPSKSSNSCRRSSE